MNPGVTLKAEHNSVRSGGAGMSSSAMPRNKPRRHVGSNRENEAIPQIGHFGGTAILAVSGPTGIRAGVY